MELTGKVIFFDEQLTKKGDGYNLTWVIEREDEFRGKIYKSSAKVEFYQSKENRSLTGPARRFTQAMKDIGATIKLEFDPLAEEYNGKWYQRLKGYNIELIEMSPATKQYYDELQKQYPPVNTSEEADNKPGGNDAPF